jgi:hypothetical protein
MEQVVMVVAFLALVLNIALGVQGMQVKEHVERDCLTAQRTTYALIDLNHALIEVSSDGDPTDKAIATARANAAAHLQDLIPKCE